MMKRVFWTMALLALLSIKAGAQGVLSQSQVVTASGALAALSTSGQNIGVHTVNYVITATVSACTLQLQYSADAVTWSSEGSAITCTASGETTILDTTARAYMRMNFTALTVSGGGSVLVTYTGRQNSLNTTQAFINVGQTFSGANTFSAASTFTGAVAQKTALISGCAAGPTALTAAQSGSLILFDRAAGCIFTLPAPAVGLYYDFLVTVTVTSNNAEVDTDAGTTFLMGAPNIVVDNSATSKAFQGNGTSHVKIQMNGTTKGGVLGTFVRIICVSATQWLVMGNLMGSGVLVTPFA